MENYQKFTDSYKRIRIAYIDAARKRPPEFQKRLRDFIAKIRENKIIVGFRGINLSRAGFPARDFQFSHFLRRFDSCDAVSLVTLIKKLCQLVKKRFLSVLNDSAIYNGLRIF